jgi:Spy/CpxP family protein refolding chaperone
MNKNVLYVAVFGVLCVLAGVATGALIVKNVMMPFPGPGTPGFPGRGGEFRRHGPIVMLTDRLELTADQKTKVEEILEKMRGEMDEIGKNIRTDMDAIKEKGDKQIMNLLTPQQKDKFKELLKDFDKGPGAGHGGPGPCPGPEFEDGFPPVKGGGR